MGYSRRVGRDKDGGLSTLDKVGYFKVEYMKLVSRISKARVIQDFKTY